MVKISKIEWFTYQARGEARWAELNELGTLPLSQLIPVRTVEFPERLPRLLIGRIRIVMPRAQQVLMSAEVIYELMDEQTVARTLKVIPRYTARRVFKAPGEHVWEIPIALDADENYFSRRFPELLPKSVVLRARLLSPQRSRWYVAKVSYLYTPWGD